MRITPKQITIIKSMVHIFSLIFMIYFVLLTLQGGFGADPVKGMEHFTGKAALNMLILTLLVSPLAKGFRQGLLMKLRRMLGLYSFFWATLHFAIYISLDLGFDFSLLGEEIFKRPYLTIGAVCWVILLLLAATSFQKIQRKMGKTWQTLHYWVYLALILAPIHYYWSVKSGLIEPSLYLVVAVLLLIWRKDFFMRLLGKFSISVKS
ncbi:TPA: protein-methionine-sulfoxide reductase heme-binding subunit MsrQ [Photobacterium damselae]|uniref:Protein-methionine-sulfoxide reductase heme-binding subunit MsrQ n=3 Tax=Photobacterium damselae TaxID=38293 RepID=A0A5F0YK99_PHODP|nr:protein-methionine-sulfoxide reductase heme-binding subunit MsrQ [Photobacterium damselae]KAB1175843.1 protein-methionine-sulfoxide reductase heme-binding subunit MsrQ [Photobacterium damselae subsp. damselae]MBE8127208.1 protein-methionine-sulfoxide reductase heme-binding subunit MsrQ [Photobacterium damselae subsp. piscicida]MBF7098592.1 protein-methionine-sulfoxide reductase heme-binding subunit MsrQ [Photobacterium damselae]MCG3845480.1 protein-methionine-sulfoxide reductase heme-binding